MTEKQGGSDLRANTTVAEPAGDGFYELTGHKWFCTHPVFDVFFTLANAPGGITCFVAERPHPGFRIQRLKDKLGGRCLASAEVLECLGGNGYVEEAPMAQFYRDIQIGTVWEGSGNVLALDVLRAMRTEPEGVPALLAECELAAGADSRFDAHLAATRERVAALGDGDPEWLARRVVEDLAVAFQASLLLRDAPPAVADAFCGGRLGEAGRAFGTLPSGVDAGAIIERALAL